MGKKLIEYFAESAKIGRLKAKMRLAVLTKTPSSRAEHEPDSPENIQLFENAMHEIRKEFK